MGRRSVCVENVSGFHYIWGQGGKSLRELEKRRGKSQLKRSSCVCCLCLLSHFKSAVWNRRRIKVGSAAIGPGQPRLETRLVTLPSVLTEQVGKGWVSPASRYQSYAFPPFLQKPRASPTPASCSLTQPLRHALGGTWPFRQHYFPSSVPYWAPLSKRMFYHQETALLGMKWVCTARKEIPDAWDSYLWYLPRLVPELEELSNVSPWCLRVADLLESCHMVRTKHFLTKQFFFPK